MSHDGNHLNIGVSSARPLYGGELCDMMSNGVASDQAGRARRSGRMNERLESLPDPDVAWIVRENRKKHRFKRLLDP